MIEKGDIIRFCNRKYSKDDEQQASMAEQYYIVSKVERDTLFVKKIKEPTAGSTLFRLCGLDLLLDRKNRKD